MSIQAVGYTYHILVCHICSAFLILNSVTVQYTYTTVACVTAYVSCNSIID